MPPTHHVSRRHALTLLGSGVLAGCLTRTDSETTDTPTTQNQGESTSQSSDGTSATPTETPAETATPTAQPAPDPTFDSGDAAWAPPTPPANGAWPVPRYGAGGTRAAPQSNGPSSFPLDRRWEQSFSNSNVGMPVTNSDGLFVTATKGEGAPSTTIARLAPASGDVAWTTETQQTVQDGPLLDGTDLYLALGSSTVAAYATSDGTQRTMTVPTARRPVRS